MGRTCVCLLLVLTSGMAGCADGDDSTRTDDGRSTEAGSGSSGFWPWSDDERPSDPVDEATAPDENSSVATSPCSGCIGLLAPEDLDDAYGASRATAGLVVPEPHNGDRALLWKRDPAEAGSRTGSDRPAAPDPTASPYATLTVYPKPDPDIDESAGDWFPPLLEIRIEEYGDHGPGRSPKTYHMVDPADGAIVEQRTLHYPDAEDTWVGDIWDRQERAVSHTRSHLHPTQRTAFEFGAHLWGRTIEEGMSFVVEGVHRDEVGLVAGVLDYDYRVLALSMYGTHALVELEIVGAEMAQEAWRFVIGSSSPYPLVANRIWTRDPLPDQGIAAEEHVLDLQRRGRTAFLSDGPSWRPGSGHVAHTHRADGTGYGLWTYDGRHHPPEFDRANIVYPLDHAVLDVRLHTGTTAVGIPPEAVSEGTLVAADLRPRWHSDLAPISGWAVWHITWLHEHWGEVGVTVERPFVASADEHVTLDLSGAAVVRAADPHDTQGLLIDLRFPPVRFVDDSDGHASRAVEELGGSLDHVNVAKWRLVAPDHPASGPEGTFGLGHEPFPYEDPAHLGDQDRIASYVELDARSGLIGHASVVVYEFAEWV